MVAKKFSQNFETKLLEKVTVMVRLKMFFNVAQTAFNFTKHERERLVCQTSTVVIVLGETSLLTSVYFALIVGIYI